MSNNRKAFKKFIPKLRLVPFFLIIAYILFLLGKAVWQNYNINLEVTNLDNEMQQLRDHNQELQKQIEYYQSSTYKEQQARLKLGYQKPGEKVFIVSASNNQPVTEEKTEIANNQTQNNRSNLIRWWQFVFK
ncbi:MAG TPA: septum formation initiator family protein [Patescibacteria group bacterium]|nr:septum formation initiator family protein [Patescibacteria group bacterium]